MKSGVIIIKNREITLNKHFRIQLRALITKLAKCSMKDPSRRCRCHIWELFFLIEFQINAAYSIKQNNWTENNSLSGGTHHLPKHYSVASRVERYLAAHKAKWWQQYSSTPLSYLRGAMNGFIMRPPLKTEREGVERERLGDESQIWLSLLAIDAASKWKIHFRTC